MKAPVQVPDCMPEETQLAELRARLQEAEETLDAIRQGEVDAVVVGGPSGTRVYTLENADRPYRVLVEKMQEGAVTLSRDGTILYCNERFADLVGVVREEILGSKIELLLSAREREFFASLLEQGTSNGSELTLISALGTRIPVLVSFANVTVADDVPRVACAIFTDQTLTRQRNDELIVANTRLGQEIEERRRAEESLYVALDAAGMGSWDFDLITGLVQRSPRFEEIFGRRDAVPTLRIETALDYFLSEDREDVLAAFDTAEKYGHLNFEKRIQRNDDDVFRWIHVIGRTYYREGRAVRIAGVVSDITDRRLMDEQLRHAQKMEAIGQLTGGVAHDFNNLLMVIGGSLEMLESRIPTDERTQKHLSAAKLGVSRGEKLNQQLLAFSRHQDLRVEPVCVDERLEAFRLLLDRAIGETVRIEIKHSPYKWYCLTDPHELETAILNLAINARDAMPNGGTLTLSTHLQHVGAHSHGPAEIKPGEYVVVEVADTGMGMRPDIVDRVFEPFFTTKGIGHGTGLGLSQVYGFAKQSGGLVSIDSTPGHGTSVRIYLPRTDDQRSTVDAVQDRGATTLGHGMVLLVEDDEDVRNVARSMLQELGYTVREADNAQSALNLLAEDAAVDLIFSDVIMPGGMNGAQLAALLKVEYPAIPLLLCSGYTAQHLTAELTLGDIQCLRKPYTAVELAEAVAAVVAHHLTSSLV
jgi:PAS domain S-box-containing protein